MAELLNDSLAQLVIWLAVLAILVVVAVYVLGRLRPSSTRQGPTGPAQQEPMASELMSKFSELHSRGGLSDAEFRTIKTKLAAQLQQELKDNGETG
jgi:uncharacterized membrane protein